jgi:polyisoprenoid-binding protein YceI
MRRHVASIALLLALASSTLAAETFRVDGEHASVVFKIKHLNMSWVWGRFNQVAGRFTLDEETPASSRFEITIQTESIDTGNQRRDRHLRNADFFDAGQFPQIRFVSAAVRKTDATHYEVTGDLTLHGVTRPLTVTITKLGAGQDPWNNYRCGGELSFTIKRSDFGMGGMLEAVGDEVTMMISLEGIRE